MKRFHRLSIVRHRKLPLKRFEYRSLSTLASDKYYVFRILGLESFTDVELRKSYGELFDRESKGDLHSGLKSLLIKKADTAENEEEINEKVRQIAEYLTAVEVKEAHWYDRFSSGTAVYQQVPDVRKDSSPLVQVSSLNPTLSFEEYKTKLRSSAEKLDKKLPAVVASAVLTGTSIGVVIPCMPILVQTIGIPPSEFGLVIAAFGVSKMFGNIPSAYFVETYGRKPVMVAGLALCGLGLGGVGLTLVDGFGTPWLIGCRLVSGLGVSAFTGGTFMLLSDISTSLNRARTPASVMAGFQSGIALGPALGGVMVNSMGVGATYFTVGGLFGIMAYANHLFLTETKPGKTLYQKRADEAKAEERLLLKNGHNTRTQYEAATSSGSSKKVATIADVGILGSFRVALLSWKELMKKPALRDVMLIHGAYWAAIAGTQMTLLPLMMVGPDLNLGASEIGMTFALISLTGVAASRPVAYLADKGGKLNTMISGCALVAASIAFMPHADSFYYILAVSVPLSVGSTTMSATPLALVTDIASTEDRAQALALLRTSSDVGLLIGATTGGIIADLLSIEYAMTGYSVLIALYTVWFASRSMGLDDVTNILGMGLGLGSPPNTPSSMNSKPEDDIAVVYDMTQQSTCNDDVALALRKDSNAADASDFGVTASGQEVVSSGRNNGSDRG